MRPPVNKRQMQEAAARWRSKARALRAEIGKTHTREVWKDVPGGRRVKERLEFRTPEADRISEAEALVWDRRAEELEAQIAEREKESVQLGGLQVNPCPFCAGTDGYLAIHGPGLFVIRCQNPKCEARGPVVGSRRGAIDRWNLRKP